jgi:hypothetical protein
MGEIVVQQVVMLQVVVEEVVVLQIVVQQIVVQQIVVEVSAPESLTARPLPAPRDPTPLFAQASSGLAQTSAPVLLTLLTLLTAPLGPENGTTPYPQLMPAKTSPRPLPLSVS